MVDITDTGLCRIHAIVEEAKEESDTTQHANIAVDFDSVLLVHQVAELCSCQSTDDAEQHSEGQRSSNHAADEYSYENQTRDCALNKIFHVSWC